MEQTVTENLPVQDLITVTQLPVIEEQLRVVRQRAETRVRKALDLVCTEDTIKEVRAARAELNKEYSELENRRKEVKRMVMEPYEKFEAIYNEYVGDIYKMGDVTLKERIGQQEGVLKEAKRQKVESYFKEYAASKNIDWLEFSRAGIKINMSTSEKTAKAQSKDFIDRVAGDLSLIESQPDAEELLVEFKKTLDAYGAVRTIEARHAAIEKERQRQQAAQQRREQQQEAAKLVQQTETQALQPPTVQPIPAEESQPIVRQGRSTDQVYQVTFTVRGTKGELIALKKFLKEGSYDYE